MKKLVPVYPWPPHRSVQEALAAMPDLTVVEAIPGGPGPVLAIREVPPFVCDAIIVGARDQLQAAVDIVTSNGIRLETVRDQVSTMLGASGMRELGEERGPRFQ